VEESILYGLPEDVIATLSNSQKHERVVDACILANGHDFVQSLPKVGFVLVV